MSTIPDFTPYPAALQDLLELGAHLIPLRGWYDRPLPEDETEYDRWKEPTRPWKDRKLCAQDVRAGLRENRWVGLIPSSLGLVVLDLDYGQVDGLTNALAARDYAFARWRSRKGWHIALRTGDSWPTGNWNWRLGDARGEIRYNAGYVVVWDPLALLEATELSREGAADSDLAAMLGKGPAQRKTAPAPGKPANWSEIKPDRYPPGNRNDKLLKDLNRLAGNGTIHNEVVLSQYRDAWMAAPEQKDGEDYLATFESMVVRAIEHQTQKKAAAAEQGVFDAKSEDNMRQGLAICGLSWAYDERRAEFIYRNGSDYLHTKVADGVETYVIRLLAANCKYERPQGGQIPFRMSMPQFKQFMKSLVYDHPERVFDQFKLFIERDLPEWNGERMYESLLHKLFGAEDTELARWSSRFPFLASLQRAYYPGCKLDETPVLIGKQGLGKSAFFAQLFPDEWRRLWFSDSLDMTATLKERMEVTMGTVLVEIGELAGVGRDWARQKAYLSSTVDKARMAYDAKSMPYERMFALVATADRRDALPNDPAGNRRFVVTECNKGANIEEFMAEHRLQLWAEAKHDFDTMVAAGETRIANLPQSLAAAQGAMNDEYRRRDDEFEELIQKVKGDGLSRAEVLEQLGLPPKMSKRDDARFTLAMQQTGWEYSRKRVKGKNNRRWWRNADKQAQLNLGQE